MEEKWVAFFYTKNVMIKPRQGIKWKRIQYQIILKTYQQDKSKMRSIRSDKSIHDI